MITAQGLNKLGFKTLEDFVLENDGDGAYISSWLSSESQPSISAITTAHNESQAEYDALEYARNRQAEYPEMGVQLNKIYDDGLAKWKSEMVDPIKAKYPKP